MSFIRSKYLRVSDLIEWGLNAPLYQRIEKSESDLWELLGVISEQFNTGRLSIRGLGGTGRSKLFLMGVSLVDLRNHFLDDIKHNLPVMVSQGLPLEKVWAGCLQIFDRSDFILEAISGPAGVRDFTSSRRCADIRIVSNYESILWRNFPEHSLCTVIEESSKIPLDSFIVEFSVFHMPVGIRNEHIIFWEYDVIEENKQWIPGMCLM